MKRSASDSALRALIGSKVLRNLGLLMALACLMAFATSASAATFNVNSTVDSVDVNPGDGSCADSLGRCTLRAAIMEANASGSANTINVPAGTYTLTLGGADDEFNVDGAEQGTGDLDILNNDLTINGAGAGLTIIDGGGIDRVFDVNNFSNFGFPVNATFSGLTIRNGNAPTSPDGYFEPGGAIQFDGTDYASSGDPLGTLTITNCEISGNTASGAGGGIWAGFGSLFVSGSSISGNSTVHAAGGGILYDGSSAPGLRTLQVTNSSISGNHANSSLGGGGIWEAGNANKTVDYNVIANNTTGGQGGGVFNGNGALTLEFNVIVGNTAGNPASTGFRNNTGVVTVNNDWWGCNTGPGASPCDRASGPTGFGITQWLKLSHTASPSSIQTNQSTTLQADFFTNNIGSPIAASDLVALNGRAVTFNNPVLGTISSPDAAINGGKANATFNAGAVAGNGSADATVDHATVTATIEIDQAATVATNPTDQTVCDGATATFTASSNGFPTPTVQWQVSTGGPFTDISGATSTTLTFTATAAQNGNQYRAVFTNSSGTATTTAATLTVNSAPTISTNPAPQTVCDGATATFTAASGSPADTVQWQVSTGGPFSNIPGATSTTLSFTASTAQSGNQYRAVFTNSCGSANTTAATLTVNPSTTATTPSDQTVCQGASPTFSTTAGGTGPFSYSWTVDGIASGNTSSISVPTGLYSVGNHTVSVTVTGTCGSATKNATLTVQENTSATTPGDQTVCQGASASFSTTASGTGPFSYSWTVDGSAFGGNTSSISVPTGALSVSSHTVSVTVTGTCGPVTKNASLTVQANTSATAPADQTVCQGANANFSTTASGTDIHYAWTVDGSAFGGDTSSISVPTGSLTAGNHPVTVTVSGACGTVTKNATLTVNTAPVVTTNPVSQTVPSGNAIFTAAASGSPAPTVQWQVSTNGGASFSNIAGATSTTLVVAVTPSVNGNQYRAVFTNTCGTATTTAATLTTCTPPVITLSSNSATMWPPNHQYHTFNLTDFVASATSNCDGNLLNSVVIASVSSDEPEDNPNGGDGATLNDIVIAPDCKSVNLRAERDGSLNGRVYTITFRVKDSVGNVSTATVKISVPVSQNGTAAVDNGPGAGYTVTSACP